MLGVVVSHGQSVAQRARFRQEGGARFRGGVTVVWRV